MISKTTYGENLARRIITGAGALTLVPYRLDPTMAVPALAHGLDDNGRFVVICSAEDAEFMGDAEIRLDGVKKALEFSVDITVASLHALARVEWQDSADTPTTLGFEPGPHLRVGVIEVETVLLHGPHGVTKCEAEELLATAESSELTTREIDARDEIARLSDVQLSTLLSGALVGMAPGFLLSESELGGCSSPAGDNLWVVDVDHSGVALLKMIDGRMTTVLVTFPEPVMTIADLAGAVDALAIHTSVRHASPRI